jgi:branched-chain amino acid transport system permease protein
MRAKALAMLSALPLLVAAAACLLPIAGSVQDFLILTVYYFLVAASWNLLAGFTGQYSFAQAGLAAFGAYVAGWVALGLGVPIWVGLLVSPIAGLVVGAVLGVIALRVRGVQLSLITFAIANAFGVFLAAAADITGGSMGMQVPRLSEAAGREIYLLLAGLIATAYLLLQDRLLSTGFALKMQAVRDDEVAAHGLGVDVLRVKVTVFALSAALAAFAGAFYAGYVGVLAPSMVSVSEMGLVVAMAVVGGLGRRFGPLLGALVLQLIAYVVRDFGAQYTLLITSGLSLIAITFFREGLIHAVEVMLTPFRTRRTRWGGELRPGERR